MITVKLYPDEYLRIMRHWLEMTQTELARMFGVSRQMVNYYEKGAVEVPSDRLETVMQMVREEEP